jgi:hypothetical protein
VKARVGKGPRSARRILRGNPFLRERVHDPYRSGEKLREATCCPECGARYSNGRWTWSKTAGTGLKRQLCPACQRIEDRYPAGEVTLAGSFLDGHRREILATVSHVGESERSEHPLNRIMSIDEQDDGTITITTTDIHLPHRIAHAIKDAWGGTMKTHYDLEGYFTRVQWERNS